MIDWQLIISLLIVLAAAIQLTRLLSSKKSNCGSCNSCPSNTDNNSPLINLDDLTSKK
ncbi:MAG: FeoB-associated Cys-rich membrane protein [Planctomycetaceae bacterium]|nr:FeoB-associated Cys-rich membrane protein [Planctomycetaceae bacterium]